jgi:hypothetical protein
MPQVTCAAVSATYVKSDKVYDGSSKIAGGTIGAFLARVPDAGLQWLVSVNGVTLKGDIGRGSTAADRHTRWDQRGRMLMASPEASAGPSAMSCAQRK